LSIDPESLSRCRSAWRLHRLLSTLTHYGPPGGHSFGVAKGNTEIWILTVQTFTMGKHSGAESSQHPSQHSRTSFANPFANVCTPKYIFDESQLVKKDCRFHVKILVGLISPVFETARTLVVPASNVAVSRAHRRNAHIASRKRRMRAKFRAWQPFRVTPLSSSSRSEPQRRRVSSIRAKDALSRHKAFDRLKYRQLR
jgi:hypothetical protein